MITVIKSIGAILLFAISSYFVVPFALTVWLIKSFAESLRSNSHDEWLMTGEELQAINGQCLKCKYFSGNADLICAVNPDGASQNDCHEFSRKGKS